MRSARYSFDCQLTLTIYRSGEKQALWGPPADISEGGVAATLSETLEVGEIALIRVEVEKKALNLRAAVRFRRGHFWGSNSWQCRSISAKPSNRSVSAFVRFPL